MVGDPDLIRLFVVPLERTGLRYMVTGAVAAVVYGEPRFTRDIDIVLDLPTGEIERLASAFAGDDYYVPSPEALEAEAARTGGGHFNVIHRDTGLRADLYGMGDDPFHAWAFERRERLSVAEVGVWVAPVEYVIVRKLEYHRESGAERHLRDVAMMLRISGERVDRTALDRWVDALGVRESLNRAEDYES